MSRFEELGRHVARTQDEQLAETPLAAERARFLASAGAPAPTRRWTAALLVPAAAALAFAVVVAWPRTEPVGLVASPEPGPTGFLAAPTDSALPLAFSDGSRVELGPGASARLLERRTRGVTLSLERGRLAASIRHRDDTDWRLHAGPFEVRVTGTRFDLEWSPQDARFTLSGLQGSVVVGGCGTEHLRSMVTGESFTATCRSGALEQGPAPEAALDAPPPLPDPLAPLAPIAPIGPPRTPGWRELATAARYSEAWAAASASGLGQLCAASTAEELLQLADCARYAGNYTGARRVLLALRQRFPGTRQAALAAFGLGRLAADALEDPVESERWFQTALAEAGPGPLARDALGRLLESQRDRGDHAAARRSAAEYLARFPEGPHAGLARTLVSP